MEQFILTPRDAFFAPEWFNRMLREPPFITVVGEDGMIDAGGEVLCFSKEGPSLPPGTTVRVSIGRYFVCVRQEDYDADQRRIAEALERARQEQLQRSITVREEAEAFNARIRLPVKWDVAYKPVLSGLMAASNGDGQNRATVQHIFLLEDFEDGRLKRRACDFLCSTDRGKEWVDDPIERRRSLDGVTYTPKVTCKTCLDRAAKWMDPDPTEIAEVAGMIEAGERLTRTRPELIRKAIDSLVSQIEVAPIEERIDKAEQMLQRLEPQGAELCIVALRRFHEGKAIRLRDVPTACRMMERYAETIMNA